MIVWSLYASIFKSFDKTVITKMIAQVLIFMFLKLLCCLVFKESPVCFSLDLHSFKADRLQTAQGLSLVTQYPH